MRATLTVLRPGLLTTVQDLGRPGHAHLGVSRSGAADADSLRLANRLAGNPEGAAGLETTMLGADVRFSVARWVAVTGAAGPVAVDGHPADADRPLRVPAGGVLSIGPADRGVRAYLAVAGGIDVPPVLGSRSTDTLSRIGPEPASEGTEWPLGEPTAPPAAVDVAPHAGWPDAAEVRLLPGPRDDWFRRRARRTLGALAWTVTGHSDRVGVRLAGPVLERKRDGALPSEGIVLGAVQVPPSGLPLVFLADHPTTGGYPVAGVVHPADLGRVAQARPGSTIRFHWWSPPA